MKKLILLVFIPLVFACSSDSSDDSSPCPNQPQLTTNEVSDISVDPVTDLASATLSGEILNIQLGDNCETFSITNQGFVYSTNIQPTIEDNVVNANGESVTVSVDGLAVETTYYVRTFITNVLGTFYGNEVSFTTPESVFIAIPEEEIITTMIVTLTPHIPQGFNTVTLTTRDLDGDGPNEPEITVSGSISSITSYSGSIQFLNEMEEDPEDITLEILEEADAHQVFFNISEGLPIQVVYADFDSNGEPLGVNFILAPMEEGATGSGLLTFTLVYEPIKPNDGTLGSAGGSIEIQTSFNVVIE